MIRAAGIAVVFIAAASLAIANDSPVHTDRIEFGPVRLSYANLFGALQRIQRLVETANAVVPEDERHWRSESLEFQHETRQVEFAPPIRMEESVNLPDLATNVSYSYRLSDAPISHVDILLSDMSRWIKVSGRSPEHVDAILRMASKDFEEHEFLIGGLGLRLCMGMLFAFAAINCLAFGIFSPFSDRLKNTSLVVGISILISINAFPWNHWFSGTMVTRGNISFLARNAHLISAVGVFLTVIGIALAVYFWLWPRPWPPSQGTQEM